MPNKLFEYVAAGIPVIACNSPEAERYVVDNGLGVSVDSIEDIPGIYDSHEEWREKVKEKREQFIMEREIDKVERIYRMVTE
jgi:glycosyltransferase involved in cell wall biosynthesis